MFVAGREFPQLVGEDDRLLVPVRVHEYDFPVALAERRLENRHHRGDSAARGEQDQVFVQAGRSEHARGRQDLDAVADTDVVAQPVRTVPACGAFDRHLRQVVGERRTGQRVTPRDGTRPIARDAQRQELPGLVGEFVPTLVGGDVEHQRPGVGRLLHDSGHGDHY